MDPQQEFFSAVRAACKALYPNDVYDTILPPPDTPYPFVYIRATTQEDARTKSCLIGDVTLNLDVYHNRPRKRGTVSSMMLAIKQACYAIEETASYKWSVKSINTNGPAAESIKNGMPPLVRGMVTINASFSPRG